MKGIVPDLEQCIIRRRIGRWSTSTHPSYRKEQRSHSTSKQGRTKSSCKEATSVRKGQAESRIPEGSLQRWTSYRGRQLRRREDWYFDCCQVEKVLIWTLDLDMVVMVSTAIVYIYAIQICTVYNMHSRFLFGCVCFDKRRLYHPQVPGPAGYISSDTRVSLVSYCLYLYLPPFILPWILLVTHPP